MNSVFAHHVDHLLVAFDHRDMVLEYLMAKISDEEQRHFESHILQAMGYAEQVEVPCQSNV